MFFGSENRAPPKKVTGESPCSHSFLDVHNLRCGTFGQSHLIDGSIPDIVARITRFMSLSSPVFHSQITLSTVKTDMLTMLNG
jgi:hypothetical protein